VSAASSLYLPDDLIRLSLTPPGRVLEHRDLDHLLVPAAARRDRPLPHRDAALATSRR